MRSRRYANEKSGSIFLKKAQINPKFHSPCRLNSLVFIRVVGAQIVVVDSVNIQLLLVEVVGAVVSAGGSETVAVKGGGAEVAQTCGSRAEGLRPEALTNWFAGRKVQP